MIDSKLVANIRIIDNSYIVSYPAAGYTHYLHMHSYDEAKLFCEELINEGLVHEARHEGRLIWFSGHDPNDEYSMLSTW